MKTPPQPPNYLSPEVSEDGKVTIRLHHPTAKAVWCEADWKDGEPMAMHRDSTGLWTCTTDPLAPDIYEYSLFADGARVIDTQNRAAKNGLTSLLHVPGPRAHEARQVTHGTVHLHWYPSEVAGHDRRMHIYTPPGYETGLVREYPVLYLFHGAGDDDSAWTQVGRLNFIMDNLIAEGRVRPMVVAMPDGHVLGRNWKEDRGTKLRAFTAEFYQHILPQAEAFYRVRRESPARAMAGLSMGGGQTISTGLTRPGMFSAFGIFSAGLWPEVTPLLEEAMLDLAQNPPETLWIAIGRKDFVFEHCAQLRTAITAGNVPFTYHEDDSSHTWRAWRDYLERFAPLLFRDT
jgi:enterochelin esterase family protein